MVSKHSSNALRNSKSHRDLFLYPLWHGLGKSKVIASARNLPKTLAIAGAILVGILALILIPAPFKISSPGTLLPVKRANIYASHEGRVVELKVSHGSPVEATATLARMESKDLELKIKEVEGQIDKIKVEFKALNLANSSRETGDSDYSERMQQRETKKKGLASSLANYNKQLESLDQQRKTLNVISPIKGNILTWNPEDLLLNRPVQMGETLFEVADTEGDWQLELKLPDKKIGHLLNRLEKEKQPKVVFMLASNPKRKYVGRYVRHSLGTEVDQEDGQYVRVFVEINKSEIEGLQNRTEVQANLFLGTAPIGYVWFHDLFDYIRTQKFKYF